MSLKTYNPGDVSVVLVAPGIAQGHIVTGFADGTMVEIERDEDTFEKVVSADGSVTRVRNLDKSGTITINLQQSSASNDVLNALAAADELNGNGVFAMLVSDANGTTVVAVDRAWIQSMPSIEFSNELVDREWIIGVAEINWNLGGNNLTGIGT